MGQLSGFDVARPVIAMIHVGALPGTPRAALSMAELEDAVRAEAAMYAAGGVHGIILENMHDLPYVKGAVGPEITAAMTRLCLAAKAESGLPLGLQILAGANIEAVAVAHAAGCQWVRVEGYVFAHVADEGIIESSAGVVLRYRRMIGAEAVQVWADIKKKHSAHAITADVSLAETAHTAEFMRADAVIVTGVATGQEPLVADLAEAQGATSLPVVLGSGITPENIGRYAAADGYIIGSYFKQGGQWFNPPDATRVARLLAAWAGE